VSEELVVQIGLNSLVILGGLGPFGITAIDVFLIVYLLV